MLYLHMVQGVWVADQRLPGSRTFINTIYDDKMTMIKMIIIIMMTLMTMTMMTTKMMKITHPAFIYTLLSQLCCKLGVSSLDDFSFWMIFHFGFWMIFHFGLWMIFHFRFWMMILDSYVVC